MKLKFSVLINNHNQERYIVECVESVLQQTYPAFEVIVVDDGSSDDSPSLLKRHFGSHPLVKIITQQHLGQATAVATAAHAAQGDIFCLLDSDDRYKPSYLERLCACYQENKAVDFVFCGREYFGEKVSVMPQPQLVHHPLTRDYDFGYTALLSYFGSIMWIGNATSMLSLRRSLAERLELDHVASHINHTFHSADQALVAGSSLLGGRKFYIHEPLVEYRCHQTNHWYTNKRHIPFKEYRNYYNLETIFAFYKRKSHITEQMRWLLPLELETVPNPMPEHIGLYHYLIRRGKIENRAKEADVYKPSALQRANQAFRQLFLKKVERLVKKIVARGSRDRSQPLGSAKK